MLKKFLYISMIIPQIAFASLDKRVEGFLDNLLRDNKIHMQKLNTEEYQSFSKVQSPTATVVLCSDSRVQDTSFDLNPVNNIFVIRNIGNQIINASGSVEYGVKFLKTPVLMIVGHSGCGAVEAVVSQKDLQNACVERELEALDLEDFCLKDAVVQNIHNQVDLAIKKFKKMVKSEELLVIGALYDFQNAYNQGVGKLIIVNLNGEIDPKKINQNKYFKDKKPIVTLDYACSEEIKK
jgi:carbonic anhydrase